MRDRSTSMLCVEGPLRHVRRSLLDVATVLAYDSAGSKGSLSPCKVWRM